MALLRSISCGIAIRHPRTWKDPILVNTVAASISGLQAQTGMTWMPSGAGSALILDQPLPPAFTSTLPVVQTAPRLRKGLQNLEQNSIFVGNCRRPTVRSFVHVVTRFILILYEYHQARAYRLLRHRSRTTQAALLHTTLQVLSLWRVHAIMTS